VTCIETGLTRTRLLQEAAQLQAERRDAQGQAEEMREKLDKVGQLQAAQGEGGATTIRPLLLVL
jgi:hypothetical protein